MDGEKEGVIPIDDVRRAMVYGYILVLFCSSAFVFLGE
jgi:hypothetical protein